MGSNHNAVIRRAVFLDRDGVLNEPIIRNGRPYPPANISELVLTPGAVESLNELKKCGFLLIVVTNQPDVRRGKTSVAIVEQIHAWLAEQLPLDDFFTCFHDDSDACSCRKPLPGLIKQAAEKYGVDLRTSYMIGDRWRDIEAGYAAGCRTIFMNRRYNERSPNATPDASVFTLIEAVRWIFQGEEKSSELSV